MATTDTLEADPVTLQNLFSADNELRCPLFQRPFVWKKANIDQLWTDIDTLLAGEYDVRFLGALVFDNEYGSTANRAGLYWIIDGQQRLTTLYLSLLALVEVADEAGDEETARDLIDQCLLSRKKDSRKKPKLRSTLQDTRQFNKLLAAALGEEVSLDIAHQHGAADGVLRDAYEITLKHVRDRCIDQDGVASKSRVERLKTALLEQLEFVEIRLGQRHDPNEVFDRLNKEGERLGIIDLVRNEVLKRLRDNAHLAAQLYAEHWQPFEEAFSDRTQRDAYFFPLVLTRDAAVTKPRTFATLAKRWQTMTKAIENDPQQELRLIMADLQEHLPAYQAVTAGAALEGCSEMVSEQARRLYAMRAPSVILPYVLQVLTACSKGVADQSKSAACLQVIESFLIRRAFVGLEPTGLHAVFKNLWANAGLDPSKVRSKVETATITFPPNAQFIEAVKHGPLYRRRICSYVLQEYERSFTAGDVMEHLPEITVDHVLPQTPEGEWLDLFRPQDLEKWTDTWANLVPLSSKANAEKGQKSWAETRKKLGNETVFSTTKNLYDDYETWTPADLEHRSQKLAEWAVERWPS